LQSNCILVTGGAGFIGSNFILDWMAAVGTPVVNLDKLTYAGHVASLERLAGDARHLLSIGDIGDRALVDDLLAMHQPRAIVNFAAESHVDRSIDAPEAFVRTNVVGTFHLLESARAYWDALAPARQEAFRFLHISTDEVYGSLEPAAPAFEEASPCAPNSPYAASKAAADHLVRAYHHTYGLPVLTTRCPNNYGPYQFPEKLIPLTILNALEGRPLPVYGDGLNVRDWLYVGDHCAALRQVLAEGRVGETYHIGARSEWRNIDVVRRICALLDEMVPASPYRPHARLIAFVADRPGHDRRYALDTRKIVEVLAWQPQESFETGLRRTVAWYLEHRAWCDAVRSGGK
jgi:dTDP-glucose 4,6-dehydratase